VYGGTIIFRERHDILVQIMDSHARGFIMENPIDFGQDLAPEDELLENSSTWGIL